MNLVDITPSYIRIKNNIWIKTVLFHTNRTVKIAWRRVSLPKFTYVLINASPPVLKLRLHAGFITFKKEEHKFCAWGTPPLYYRINQAEPLELFPK